MINTISSKLLMLPGILLAISIHEFSHGYAAVKLGDNTPMLQGRLTLNPLKHIDPIGFLCLLFIGFGWAKPVMINSRNFKNPRRDDFIVSLAGPLSNFLMAFIFVGLMKVVITFMPNSLLKGVVLDVFRGTVSINLVLMIFNLLPIPPLDGHHILGSIGGRTVWNFYHKYYDYLRFGLLLLIIFNVIGVIITPPIQFLYGFLLNIFF
ncbi:MAG: site-2 protease family protein [Tissierellia bacterium]|nr:site-2 protease family protein [Tissierellia bacterium]